MPNPLTTTGIILNLSLRKWAGEVSDKTALQAVADTFKSDTHNDKYKKSLFVNDPLSMVDRCAGRLRNHFYARTLSWLDGGQGRLIPSKSFRDFANEHTPLKMQFYQEVDTFIDAYPDHQALAKERKGDLYHEGEYPSVEDLRTRFEVKLITLPFPDVEDFRVDAAEDVIEELQISMKESAEHVQHVLSDELKLRLAKRLQMLHKTLLVGKRFNKSLLTEIQDLVSMSDNLRDSVEANLRDKFIQVKKEILIWTPEQIRNSETVQNDLTHICYDIIQKL
jgi:hypothetical protein